MNTAPSLDILDGVVISSHLNMPLHHQVRQFLRGAIEEHFEDGQSFWTEMLLVERLGVSRVTVRRALDELARDGMLVREASRRTFVRKSVVTSLGVIFRRIKSDYLTEMLHHIAEQCLERDLHLELYPTFDDLRLNEVIQKIRGKPSEERLILTETGTVQGRYLHDLLGERGYRTVALGVDALEGYTERYDGSFASTDPEVAVRLAWEHLRALGHRNIVFLVNEPPARESVRRKIAEFERLKVSQNLSEGRTIICQSETAADSFHLAYDAMPALWALEPRPTAIFTASDPGAWAALRWFAQHDIKVPAQVSVVGFENVKPDAFTHPPLTSVGHTFSELARHAVEALWQETTTQVLVPPTLVVRESTGPRPQ